MTYSKNHKLLGSFILLAVLLVVAQGCGKGSATAQRRGEAVMPVLVAPVAQRDVPIDIEVIGNVEAYSTVSVKAQVGGQLLNVHFNEGDYVHKDDILFEIDRRPFQAQLAQMTANEARDEALLGQAEANLARDIAQQEYAQQQADRYEVLSKNGISTKEQADQMRSNANALAQAVKADRAAIESARAQIVASKAAMDNSRVMLGYTTIRSPLEGRTGTVMVKQGNVVVMNTMDLTTINQVQPIYVTFSVPEANLADVKKYMSQGDLRVFVVVPDGDARHEDGKLTFVDNSIDLTTGTIKLKATFPNSDRRLWPGQFVRVVLRLTTRPNGIVVPNQAVQTGQDGQFVFVMKPDQTVELRPVKVGARVDQDVVIDNGLQVGETVVTDGQLRLAAGSRVQVREGRGGGTAGGGGKPATKRAEGERKQPGRDGL